jgi:membrane protein implicated in regulation of membrane protease activity
MLQNLSQTLGPWGWAILGLILLSAEIFLPGVYLVWFGLAGITLGIISLALWDFSFWTWHFQLIAFAVLSLAYVVVARRTLKSSNNASDEPNLNNREASLIGRTAVLSEPIIEGRGRIKLDDTWWRIEGADAPIGARVEVISAAAQLLHVRLITPVENQTL